jgi:superfamily II DNA or RNA helicase
MPNLVEVNYAQTGQSMTTDAMGMRDMQQRAYEARASQYILLKAPPASGKSRALMFLALDKLHNQGISKVIVSVPERIIGSSFNNTELSEFGFFADWEVEDRFNLCMPGGDKSKVEQLKKFLTGEGQILICTHATLRFAYDALKDEYFNNTLLAIDEFHHVSVSEDNQLGELLRAIIHKSDAHVIAMTGSYFRGDSAPILAPEDERKFDHVTYNYYEQLNGYDYLKSLGIGYHFYQGKYTSAIHEVLKTNQKTILHIPNVNTGESTKDKYQEVDQIIDIIGKVVRQDEKTGVIHLKRHGDGKEIKVADLVYDEPNARDRIVSYLRSIEHEDDLDLIIALGMAKEGFDWSFCEHALTVGYRGSLTEIVQIIGRATRDSSNKTHAQFTNLIAQPDAQDDEVKVAVNNMLKAITCSLLMEQVMAPVWKFKRRESAEEKNKEGELAIGGFKEPTSERVKEIIASDLDDLKATILQGGETQQAISGTIDPEVINKVLIPKVIQRKYPELTPEQVEELRQHVVVDSVLKSGEIKEEGDKRFIRMANQFINIDDLHIDLIDRVNPFQKAFEIISKTVTAPVLKAIKECIDATRIQMVDEEALILWPKIKAFVKGKGKEPDIDAFDPLEQRMAAALIYLKRQRREQGL